MNRLYSIIVPCYNCENTIEATYKSLIKQSYKNIEIIMINDGSKDSTLKTLKDYSKRDKRIIVIDQVNSGVSVARNSGLDKAKGDYIIFVDADDYLEKNAIETINKKLDKEETDVLKYNYYRVVGKNKLKAPSILEDNLVINCKEFDQKNSVFEQIINTYNFSAIWTSAYKRSAIKGIYFTKGITYAEDFEFNLRVYEKIKSISYIDVPLYNYLYNPESVTQVVNEDKIMRNLDSARKAYKYLFQFIKNVKIEHRREEVVKRYINEQITIVSRLILIKKYKDFKNQVDILKGENITIEFLKNNRNMIFDNTRLYYCKRKLIQIYKKTFRAIK